MGVELCTDMCVWMALYLCGGGAERMCVCMCVVDYARVRACVGGVCDRGVRACRVCGGVCDSMCDSVCDSVRDSVCWG